MAFLAGQVGITHEEEVRIETELRQRARQSPHAHAEAARLAVDVGPFEADDHEDRLGVRKEPQNGLDHLRRVMLDGDGDVAGGRGPVLNETAIDSGQQHRRGGKELRPVRLGEHRRRSPNRHHEIQPPARQRGSNLVHD